MKLVSIGEIQGAGLLSPLGGETIITRGVVTGVQRRGFFIQTPNVEWDGETSDGIFVYSQEWTSTVGSYVEVNAEVVDYYKHETAKPVTQLHLDTLKLINRQGPEIKPIELTAELVPLDDGELADQLNGLEGMLLKIPAGQTFISPSNPHGDYVVALDSPVKDQSWLRSEHNGMVLDHDNNQRWFPGFRITRYHRAPRLNVGSTLLNDVIGPLNYRVDSYQLAVNQDIEFEENFVSLERSNLTPSEGALTVMTLNCFNLDPHVESEDRVLNPQQDIDDDWGEGRFHTLAQAVVLQANTPDIVALQEIQDNDGAEISDVVDASETYKLLIHTIEQLSGIEYKWVNIDPLLGMDGGQPGGNIRNGYLYNPHRVRLVDDSVYVIGRNQECYEDSRKPLIASFEEIDSGKKLACVNVHLASKRHQASIFAPQDPGVDAKLPVRVAQAERIHAELLQLRKRGLDYYVTGDFNDTELSETLQALVGEDNVNLVFSLPENERYDYNHRGKLQVLMHGIVHASMTDRCDYEIIHGNELIGVKPGEETDKPSDHAYVIAKITL